jgi:hypothetical protein
MRTFVLSAFASCSIVGAAPPAASAQTEVARFAATTVSDGQGARAVISNVSASGTDRDAAPCKVQVRFFGPDGSLVGNAGQLQLRGGMSGSVTATASPPLVRATVSIDGSGDPPSACELKARVEIFDLHTGTTFISVASDAPARATECSVTSSISDRSLWKRKTKTPSSLGPITSRLAN